MMSVSKRFSTLTWFQGVLWGKLPPLQVGDITLLKPVSVGQIGYWPDFHKVGQGSNPSQVDNSKINFNELLNLP